MFGLFKKKASIGETVVFRISGMHCTSCSMNIDGELEDTDGVVSADTSYAKAITKVVYDPKVVSVQKLKDLISALEYEVELLE